MTLCHSIKRCRVCEGRRLKKFFDLGKHPLANTLPARAAARERRFPLSLSFCADCGLAELNETVDPKVLFADYPWVTGTSRAAREFAPTFAARTLAHTRAQEPFVAEVGSNDGTFLRAFAKRGAKVLGIDPAGKIARAAARAGVPTLAAFFSEKTARRILSGYGPADIVVARNVLYHLANLLDVMRGIADLLSPKGVFAAEFHYAGEMLRGLHYDTIYHEHVCYYTLKTFERLLARADLHAFDVGWSPINAGGLIVYASKESRRSTLRLRALRKREAEEKVNTFGVWKKFARDAVSHRKRLKTLLRREARTGRGVAGYGASARSSTLLNFCGIDRRLIKVVADGNPLKHGRFTAGSGVPIESPDEVFGGGEKRPDTVFLLAWNFADEILDILRKKYHYRGRVIIPLPGNPRVVTVR